MEHFAMEKLMALKKYKGEGYCPLSEDDLYDDFHELCYQQKVASLLENNIDCGYNFVNVSQVDLTSLSYEELEELNFHWAQNKYRNSIDKNGIPATIGDNSRGIDKTPSIFFSRGVEGVLELWNTWLKWRLYRLESPFYDGLTEDDIAQNINRYMSQDITRKEMIRWVEFNNYFKSKRILSDENIMNKLFEYQFLEMQMSSYYDFNLAGLGFNPLESIDYNKVRYLKDNKSNKYLEIQYDYYSDLDSIYSDKWNYKIGPKNDSSQSMLIDSNRIRLLSVDGSTDLNTILVFLYDKYQENVSEDRRVKFDVLDDYIKFIKEKGFRKQETDSLNDMMTELSINDKSVNSSFQHQ